MVESYPTQQFKRNQPKYSRAMMNVKNLKFCKRNQAHINMQYMTSFILKFKTNLKTDFW